MFIVITIAYLIFWGPLFLVTLFSYGDYKTETPSTRCDTTWPTKQPPFFRFYLCPPRKIKFTMPETVFPRMPFLRGIHPRMETLWERLWLTLVTTFDCPTSHEVTLHVAFVHAFVNPTLFLVLHKGLRKATVDLLCCNFRSSDSSRGGAAEDGVWYTVHIFFETQLFKFQLKENSSFFPLSFFILVAAGILFFWQFFLVANLPVKFAFRARSEVEALLKLHFQQTCLTFLSMHFSQTCLTFF